MKRIRDSLTTKKPKDTDLKRLEDERSAVKDAYLKCTQQLDSTTATVTLLRQFGLALSEAANKLTDTIFSQCLELCGKFNVAVADMQLKVCQLTIEKLQIPMREYMLTAKEQTLKRKDSITTSDWEKLDKYRVSLAEKMCEYIEEYRDYFKKGLELIADSTEQAARLKSAVKTDRFLEHEHNEPTVTFAPDVEFSAPQSHATTNTSPMSDKKKPVGMLFGRDLIQLVTESNTVLPPVCSKMMQYIESEEVIDTIGLFRIAGPTGKVQALKEDLDQGKDVDFAALNNPHIVCTVLKSFFRNLPESLIISSKFDAFIDAAKEVIESKQINQLRALVESLPPQHAAALDYLIAFCRRIASRSEYNKMNAKNLASLIAPNILYRRGPSMTLLEDMNFANTVVEIMINKYDEIFKNITYTEKSRTTVTVVEPTSHHQRSDSGTSRAESDQESDLNIEADDAEQLSHSPDSKSTTRANGKDRDDKPKEREGRSREANKEGKRERERSRSRTRHHAVVKRESTESPGDDYIKPKETKSPNARARAAQLLSMGDSTYTDSRTFDVGGVVAPQTLDKGTRRRSSSLSTPSPPLVEDPDSGYNSDDQKKNKQRVTVSRHLSRNRLNAIYRSSLKFENSDVFATAMEEIFHPANYSGYVVVGYTKNNALRLQTAGFGCVADMVSHLKDDEVQYCLLRLRIENREPAGCATRDVFIHWNGPKVSNLQKGLKQAHVGEVKQILHPFHAELVATSKANFTEEVVLDRSDPLSGSHVID